MNLRLNFYLFIQNNSPATINYINEIENSFHSRSIGKRLALLFLPLPSVYDTVRHSGLAAKHWVCLNFKEACNETTKITKTAALVVFLVFCTPINFVFPNCLWKAPEPEQPRSNSLRNENTNTNKPEKKSNDFNDSIDPELKKNIELLRVSSNRPPNLDFMLDLSFDDKKNVTTFIQKLEKIFNLNKFISNKNLVFNFVCELFYAFKDNEQLQGSALAAISTHIETCEDQTLKLLNILFCMHKIENLNSKANTKSFQNKLKILVSAFKCYTLDSIIKQKIKYLYLKNDEELELSLYMQIKLADSLELPVLIKTMNNDECTIERYSSIINQSEEIKNEVNNTYFDSLFESEIFQALLEKNPNENKQFNSKQSLELDSLYDEFDILSSQLFDIKKDKGELSPEFLDQQILINQKNAQIKDLQRKLKREWIEEVLSK